MSAITRHFTLEDHIKYGTATKEETAERKLLEKLRRRQAGGETRSESTKRELTDFFHGDREDRLIILQRAINHIVDDLVYALSMMPTINPYTGVNDRIKEIEKLNDMETA